MTEDEKKRIAKDGEIVRVPLLMMDAQQRAVANQRTVKDVRHHRPHEAVLTDAERVKRMTRVAMDKQRLSNRWKGAA